MGAAARALGPALASFIRPVKLFGLTGGIGMGKSACADLLLQSGIRVVDTDSIARDLTRPGMPAVARIASELDSSVVDPSGHLRRDALAAIVFRDVPARQRLEAILHPLILAAWQLEVAAWNREGVPVGVVVIPLLFETGAETLLDATVCVACSRLTQARRLQARGWSDQQTEQRCAAQMPVEMKIDRADHVIWSEGGLDVLAAQTRRVFLGGSPHEKTGGLLSQPARNQTQL